MKLGSYLTRLLVPLTMAGARRKSARPTGKGSPAKRQRPGQVLLKARRWLDRTLMVVAMGGVMVALWWSLGKLTEVPVGHIEITGNLQHASNDRIRQVVGQNISRGFVALELDAIKEQLETLPWVYRASVRRRWPDKLVIRIAEQRPIARWGESDLLNHEGDLFGAATQDDPARWDHLPTLIGPMGAHREMMDSYLFMVESLAPLGLVVDTLEQDSLGGVRLRLDSGFSLILGRENLDEKIARFSVVYQRQLVSRREQLTTVDLRYSHGMAVRFDEAKQLASVGNSRMGE